MWQWICGKDQRHLVNGLAFACLQRTRSSFSFQRTLRMDSLYYPIMQSFCYKCTDFYHPNDEGGLLWSDPEIGVEWPMPEGMTVEDLTFSEKDTKWSGIKEYKK